ncbi:MAG TPA: hypothetical protein VJO16_13410 [Candidatus Acidoferrum sp.]|nr:hypothetical protein [Candidatus Acidoferrum sp.]
MKAFHFFKLTTVSALAALGLLSVDAAHAQAPSGPITAAPARPDTAAAPARTPNPVPAPKPRTTILGDWKLNPDESDDRRNRRQDSEDSNGGGRGRIGGGYPGSGRGGYGGHPVGGESEEQRQKMQTLLRPAKSLKFSVTGAEVDVIDDQEFKLEFMTDGRKLQKSKDASYQEIAAKWDGTRLVSDEKDPRGNKMSRTFELSSDGLQLYEMLHMTYGRNNSPRVIRYVYDIPVQTAQTKQ